MTWRWPRSFLPSSFCSSRNSESPAIDVSGLFSSCATPDTSCPTAASFSLCTSCVSSACCSVTSSTMTTTLCSVAAPGMRAALTRTARFSRSERATSGAGRSPRRIAVSSSCSAFGLPNSASPSGVPTTLCSGVLSRSASARFERFTRPSSSTTAMPSLKASKAVSHCSLARRTISKNRAFAMTTAAWVASVDSSRMSSGTNTPSFGSVMMSVPITMPCDRSGTAAAAAASNPCTITVGCDPEQRQQGALRVEKADGVAHHLLDDPVQLERVREDVRQLLEGKELGQTAIELLGGATALVLGAQQPLPEPPHHETRGDDSQRDRDRRELECVLSQLVHGHLYSTIPLENQSSVVPDHRGVRRRRAPPQRDARMARDGDDDVRRRVGNGQHTRCPCPGSRARFRGSHRFVGPTACRNRRTRFRAAGDR